MHPIRPTADKREKYDEKYSDNPEIYLIGVEFSKEERNITYKKGITLI